MYLSNMKPEAHSTLEFPRNPAEVFGDDWEGRRHDWLDRLTIMPKKISAFSTENG